VGLHADHQALAVGDRDRDLGAELVLLVRFAPSTALPSPAQRPIAQRARGDAGDLGRVQSVELVPVGALLRPQSLTPGERLGEVFRDLGPARKLAPDVAEHPPEVGLRRLISRLARFI
jgi:hypothetical protein